MLVVDDLERIELAEGREHSPELRSYLEDHLLADDICNRNGGRYCK